MKKVELLAPAGNYEALRGAVAAGADAVYLGGSAFGARAYAENFSQEEICRGIHFAHLFHVKIYLTVNTLVKEKEFESLYYFLCPFYEAGLDGVIIQDMGVFYFIRKHFPGLELHVSTQMTITGFYGAQLLKQEGASRIVPARELSLQEIKQIKKNADIEIETFIHGAMCYCYSGQCLFSSILGGRSGNRGRCAQPCRLPYRINGGKEEYPLSMKDMCTLNILPELIEAGIDSFKIEGRMKKPEYAAGVTAVYRKYLDLYYQCPEKYQIENKDLDYLKSLYIRTDIGEGYYKKYSGKDMVTLTSPAYLRSDEQLLKEIRKTYLEAENRISVSAKAVLKAGQPAVMELTARNAEISVSGDLVQKAEKQPLTYQKIKEQLLKSGETAFKIEDVQLDADENIFMPISSLNCLRRNAVNALEEKITALNGFAYKEREKAVYHEPAFSLAAEHEEKKEGISPNPEKVLHILVNTADQLMAAVLEGCSRIYIDKLLINNELISKLRELGKGGCEFYLAFPYIVRGKDSDKLEELYCFLKEDVFAGALIRNLETLSFLEQRGFNKKIVSDINIYVWNSFSCRFLKGHVNEIYVPAELNKHELLQLKKKTDEKYSLSVMIYGRLPMMISANCISKTTDKCGGVPGFLTLSDRYSKEFPVYTDCVYCYNVIYNSVPLSLHSLFRKGHEVPLVGRLDFTVEDRKETEAVIKYFKGLLKQYKEPFYKEYTTGHYKRGVE